MKNAIGPSFYCTATLVVLLHMHHATECIAQLTPVQSPSEASEEIQYAQVLVYCKRKTGYYDVNVERQPAMPAMPATERIQLIAKFMLRMEIHERALAISAISQLMENAAQEIFDEATVAHESEKLDDGKWIKSIAPIAQLLPESYGKKLVNFMELWQEKYPHLGTKCPHKNEFRFCIQVQDHEYKKSQSFLRRACRSKTEWIANSAHRKYVEDENKRVELLRKSAVDQLQTVDSELSPAIAVHGFKLNSKLNPTWQGQQELLRKMTKVHNQSVASMAIRNHVSLEANHGLLAELLESGTALEKRIALEQVNSQVIADWGSESTIRTLLSDEDKQVRNSAIESMMKLHPGALRFKLEYLENEDLNSVRKTRIQQGWGERWTVNEYGDSRRDFSSDEIFAAVARAKRAGLKTYGAMNQLTRQFGYHPDEAYEIAASGSETKKTKAVDEILTCDPSVEATETAIRTLRSIIKNAKESENHGEYLARNYLPELVEKHASRLGPLVPDLIGLIRISGSPKLLDVMKKFEEDALPAVDFLIEALEKRTDGWHSHHANVILALRASKTSDERALRCLEKYANSNSQAESLTAALAYLDLGGDPELLSARYATSFPLLVKLGPERAASLKVFQSRIINKSLEHSTLAVISWLGPHADFMTDHLVEEFRELTEKPNRQRHDMPQFLFAIGDLGEQGEKLLPHFSEFLAKKERYLDKIAVLDCLMKYGDKKKQVQSSVSALMTEASRAELRDAATKAFNTLYVDKKVDEEE